MTVMPTRVPGSTAPRQRNLKPLTLFMMDATSLVGLSAGCLTTLAFVPQVHKIWRSKSVHDLSQGMFTLFSVGVLLWLIYGVLIDALPAILANAITLLLSLAILLLKLHYRHTPRAECPQRDL